MDFISALDFFGNPGLFQFKRRTQFKTVCGGILSFCLFCFLIVYFASTVVHSMYHANIKSVSYIKSPQTVYHLSNVGLMIILFNTENGEILIDPDKYLDLKYQTFKAERCNSISLQFYSEYLVKIYQDHVKGIYDNSFCLNAHSLMETFSMFNLSVQKLDAHMPVLTMNIYYIKSSVLEHYEKRDAVEVVTLNESKDQAYEVGFKYDVVKKYEAFFGSEDKEILFDKTFLNKVDSKNNFVFSVKFIRDTNRDCYEIRYYNFFDHLSYIGGICYFCNIFGWAFSGIYEKSFYIHLANELSKVSFAVDSTILCQTFRKSISCCNQESREKEKQIDELCEATKSKATNLQPIKTTKNAVISQRKLRTFKYIFCLLKSRYRENYNKYFMKMRECFNIEKVLVTLKEVHFLKQLLSHVAHATPKRKVNIGFFDDINGRKSSYDKTNLHIKFNEVEERLSEREQSREILLDKDN